MRNHVFDPVVLIAALAIFLVGAPPASANVAQPPERMAFEFFDEAGLPLIPESLQLVGCQEQECQTPVLLFQEGICNDPGCLPARGKIRMPFCSENFCRVDAYTFDYPHYGLILLPALYSLPERPNLRLPRFYHFPLAVILPVLWSIPVAALVYWLHPYPTHF